MKGAIQVLLTAICFGGFGGGARAQLSDSEGSAQWVAARIALDGGGSAADYLDYAHRLAKTMSQYPASVQKKIFGFMPPVSGKTEDSEDSSNSGGKNDGDDDDSSDGGKAMMSPAAALANPDLSSGEVFDALLSQSPLSDADVLGMLEREPALEKEHLTDLLYAQGKLNRGTLISALSSAKLKLGREELKSLLISQSPLDKSVLKKVESTSNLSPNDIAEVLAAQ